MTPLSKFLTACVMSLAIGSEFAANAATLPQLPHKQVDVTMPTMTGNTYNATCTTFQAQINAAAAANVNLTHEVILGPNGTTCTGPFVLPSHTGGTGWILIKGPKYASLPASGTRVSLSDATLMPKIKYGETGSVNGAIAAVTGAQRYRIIGLDIIQNNLIATNNNLIDLGRDSEWASDNTGYFVLDRLMIHDTNATHNTNRGVAAGADVGHVALIDSYCAGIKSVGKETQCFHTDNNPGPILVQNNFLEAAGENTMLCGGVDPDNAAHMPQDATFRLNTYSVNPAWYARGGGYDTKTLFELKCGNRILVEANTFENMPQDGGGYAFRLTPRNIFGDGTFSEMSDITIRYNLVKNVNNWIQLISNDDQGGSLITKHSKRIYIHDNLVYGLGFQCWLGGGCGSFLTIAAGGERCTDPTPTCKIEDLTVTHNTVDDISGRLFCVMRDGARDLNYRDNLINNNAARGLLDCDGGAGGHYGTTRLNEAWGATWSWVNNSIAMSGGGESTANYPQGTNSFPSSADSFLWTNQAARDYTLQAGSPAKNSASDGTDRGVNFTAYNAARAGSSGGVLTPPSIPRNLLIR